MINIGSIFAPNDSPSRNIGSVPAVLVADTMDRVKELVGEDRKSVV